jgi:hypothetical protein
LECNVLETPVSYDKYTDLSSKHVLNRKQRAISGPSFLPCSSVLNYAGLLIKVRRPVTLQAGEEELAADKCNFKKKPIAYTRVTSLAISSATDNKIQTPTPHRNPSLSPSSRRHYFMSKYNIKAYCIGNFFTSFLVARYVKGGTYMAK